MPSAASYNPLLTNPTAGTGSTASNTPFLNSVVPGNQNLANSASTITQNLLNGLPTTSAARKANAVFGVNSGLAPGSDFLKTRLYDTYGTQVDERNQRGFQDYLALIGALSSPELSNRSQQNQSSQFAQSLAEQKQEFADRLAQTQAQFDANHDLELQKFGFDRSRYYSSQPKSGSSTIPNVSPAVPGAGEANYRIDQRNAGRPEWWY